MNAQHLPDLRYMATPDTGYRQIVRSAMMSALIHTENTL